MVKWIIIILNICKSLELICHGTFFRVQVEPFFFFRLVTYRRIPSFEKEKEKRQKINALEIDLKRTFLNKNNKLKRGNEFSFVSVVSFG